MKTRADEGLANLPKALNGVELDEKLEEGTQLLTAFAHLLYYIEKMTKGTNDIPTSEKCKTSIRNSYIANTRRRISEPAPLFLTETMLRVGGSISARGLRVLQDLSEAQTMRDWNGNTVTWDIIAPACGLFVDVFSLGKKVEGRVKWSAVVDDSSNIKLKMICPTDGRKIADTKSIIVIKTPKAMGDGIAAKFTHPKGDWDLGLRRLFYEIVERVKDVWDERTLSPEGDCVHSALAWSPAHFIPLVYDGESLGISRDLVNGTKGEWPELVTSPDTWTRFFSVLAAWIFMVLISADNELLQEWEALCPEQVGQAKAFVSASKIPNSHSWCCALVRLWAAALHTAYQAYLRLVATLLKPSRFQSLEIQGYDTLMIDARGSHACRLPFGWTLPDPDRTHTSSTALTFVYTHPNIVVKVYNDVQCYARERAAYDMLRHLQGAGIPVLYASGRCAGDGSLFLVMSNEGKSLDQLTETQRSELGPLVDQIHKAHVHHHDLHMRNVVRSKGGQLKIVDFGEGVVNCAAEGCRDDWKAEWE